MPTKDATAAKKSKSRPKKDAASGATASESSDELEIEDDDPPELTPALLSVSMPTDERGKTLYRAVQAVWSPRNKPVDPEKVRGGMANYGDTIRGLRDAWRTKNESLRKAELPNSPTAGDAPGLKEEVARYRQLLEVVMARSLQYGHLAIVKRYVTPHMSALVRTRPILFSDVARHGPASAADHIHFGILCCLPRRIPFWPKQVKRGPVREGSLHNAHVHRPSLVDSLRIAVFCELP